MEEESYSALRKIARRSVSSFTLPEVLPSSGAERNLSFGEFVKAWVFRFIRPVSRLQTPIQRSRLRLPQSHGPPAPVERAAVLPDALSNLREDVDDVKLSKSKLPTPVQMQACRRADHVE